MWRRESRMGKMIKDELLISGAGPATGLSKLVLANGGLKQLNFAKAASLTYWRAGGVPARLHASPGQGAVGRTTRRRGCCWTGCPF